MSPAKHPAKFPPRIVGIAAGYLRGYTRVLDPFSGSGRVHDLSRIFEHHDTVGVDIERDWEQEAVGANVLGNSLQPPFRLGCFDAVFTSPVYPNRMTDHHNARDASTRNTYTHRIGHKLHKDNAGAMSLGLPHWQFHENVWAATLPLLRSGGRFVLNTKDFYRTVKKGQPLERVYVTNWHTEVLINLGLALVASETVPTPGNRFGANRGIRVESEDIMIFDKP